MKKKLLVSLLLFFFLPITTTKAIEKSQSTEVSTSVSMPKTTQENANISKEYPEITNDIEIRYKWYKEIIEGDYYPKKDQMDGYLIDYSKTKYSGLGSWNGDNCSLPDEYYYKEYDTMYVYRKIQNVRYVKFENFTYNNNVKIYISNEPANYTIMSNIDNVLILDLKKTVFAETITFYIENAKNFKISLYRRSMNDLIISREVTSETMLIPDKTWTPSPTAYCEQTTDEFHPNTDLTTEIGRYPTCRYRELYVYKYKVKREYYDDDYHLNVEGYIKDMNDYKIFYKGEPITNTIEIIKEKIIKEPQTEYVYMKNEQPIKNDSSNQIENTPQVKTQTKTIKKEIYKVPKKVYIIIIIMTLTIITLAIISLKKYVVRNN